MLEATSSLPKIDGGKLQQKISVLVFRFVFHSILLLHAKLRTLFENTKQPIMYLYYNMQLNLCMCVVNAKNAQEN